MIKHFFTISLRVFKTKRPYSIINVISLSICILIIGLVYLFIKNETSFDKFHEESENIYRVESNISISNGDDSYSFIIPNIPDPFVDRIRAEIPGILNSTRLVRSFKNAIVRYELDITSEPVSYVDNDFFKMFSFKMIVGEGNLGFSGSTSVVITQKLAKRIFKNDDPIGKILTVENSQKRLYKVIGVIQDPPPNSSIDYSILAPIESWEDYLAYQDLWNEFTYSFFLKVSKSVSKNELESQLNRLFAFSREVKGKRSESQVKISVTPLREIHWNIDVPWHKVSNIQNLHILTGIVLIIVLIACFNYISLTIVTVSSRRIEVGIKKVFGATKTDLLRQFILESLLYSSISGVVGFLLIYISLPYFNMLIGEKIAFALDIYDWLSFLGIIFIISLLVGIYPTFLVTSLETSSILKSDSVIKIRVGLISVFVVFQFTVSLFLGNCAFVMTREMEYIYDHDIGFDKSQVLIIPLQSFEKDATLIVQEFKNLAMQEPSVMSVSSSSIAFFRDLSSMGFKDKNGESKSARMFIVDTDFVETLGLSIIKGRNFIGENAADSSSIIINESLADLISNSPDPINETFLWGLGEMSPIIGIAKNFNFRSLEHPVEPAFLTIKQGLAPPSILLIKLGPHETPSTITRLKSIFQKIAHDSPFDFRYLNDDIKSQYLSYERWSALISYSSWFAAFVACIGLYGLAGLTSSNRRREMAIRKALGASFLEIIALMSRRYLLLVLISSFIGGALSYLAMSKWLMNFAYKVPLTFEPLLYGVLVGLVIVLVAISYPVVKVGQKRIPESLNDIK